MCPSLLPNVPVIQLKWQTKKNKTQKHFYKYHDVFSKSDLDPETTCTDTSKNKITLTDGVQVNLPYLRIPPKPFEEIKQHIRQLLNRDIIRESTMAYPSPIVIVRKKTGELHLWIDYQKLNSKTLKDAYPPPSWRIIWYTVFVPLFFDPAFNFKIYQVAVEKNDKQKTAFTTLFVLYEFNTMPYGLCNAPTTFQRLMQHCFRDEAFQIHLVFLY